MALYQYSARNDKGELISGTRQAPDQKALTETLRSENCFPIAIDEFHAKGSRFSLTAFFRQRENIVHFTRHLSNLLNSGIQLERALKLLSEHTHPLQMRSALGAIHNEVAEGKPFYEALKRYPKLFSNSYINMIQAAETSGSLAIVISKLADFLEQKNQSKEELFSILMYPVVVLMVGMGTVLFIMLRVIPKMRFIFNDMAERLPLITKVLLWVSSLASKFWLPALLLVLIGVFFVLRALKRPRVRLQIDEALLKTFFIGGIITKIEFSRFGRILGLQLSQGVSIVEALSVSTEVVGNRWLHERLNLVHAQVEEGASLAESLLATKAFSPFIVEAVSVGEETATLPDALLNNAALYENEALRESRKFLSILEPLIIVFLALMVGVLVMAVLLPIFEINLQM